MTAMLETGPETWAGVLGTYRGDLVRAARTRLGTGGADAEDVVHDVVVRMLRGGKEASDMATPGAYLRRAVGNECVSRWRRTSREVMVAELPDRPRMAPDEAVLDRIALNDAMRVLTPRQRKVIVRTVLDDRPDSEVAAELGVSEVTVRTTRSRALARLRERLTAMDEADLRPGTGVTRITAIGSRPAPVTVPAPRISA
jgi:RNA polymerase sigma factor (sigma-70 family)